MNSRHLRTLFHALALSAALSLLAGGEARTAEPPSADRPIQGAGIPLPADQPPAIDGEPTLQATSCVQPPNSTLVAWYPFDEASGPSAGNLATANLGKHLGGPVPTPGKVARALRFDGVDDYVESPSSIVTNFGPASTVGACGGGYSTCPGDFSIDAWIRMVPPGGGVQVIVDKRVGTPVIRGYSFFVGNNAVGLQLADGTGSGFTNFSSNTLTPSLFDGNWHHVAVTVRRNSACGISFYHNGIYSGSGNPMQRKGSLANTSPLRIGTRTAASPLSGWLKGEIDELQIFNRELTPQEVQAIYAAGSFGKCK